MLEMRHGFFQPFNESITVRNQNREDYKMKKLFLITTACLFSAAPALALDHTFDCRGGSAKFASPSEKTSDARDVDPVYKIRVRIWRTDVDTTRAPPTDKFELQPVAQNHMRVSHVTQSERVIDRFSQYTGNLDVSDDTWVWLGSLDRDPSTMMSGALHVDNASVTYTETRYKNGKAEWSNRTNCHPAR